LTESGGEAGDRGVGDALRDAIERTLQATAGSAAVTRERAGELVDELARRGREARGELTRRGQVAGAELARRGQDAGAELARRLEALEQRLAEVEEGLRREATAKEKPADPGVGAEPVQEETKPKAEG
jgi:polyhydroxyalkanoate synthesis regulator phasin